MNPWLEVKLPSPVLISFVTIINSKHGCWERLVKVEIRAGMAPVPDGFTAEERGADVSKKLEVTSRGGFFAGPPDGFAKGMVTSSSLTGLFWHSTSLCSFWGLDIFGLMASKLTEVTY